MARTPTPEIVLDLSNLSPTPKKIPLVGRRFPTLTRICVAGTFLVLSPNFFGLGSSSFNSESDVGNSGQKGVFSVEFLHKESGP